jgi:hypothetical protein
VGVPSPPARRRACPPGGAAIQCRPRAGARRGDRHEGVEHHGDRHAGEAPGDGDRGQRLDRGRPVRVVQAWLARANKVYPHIKTELRDNAASQDKTLALFATGDQGDSVQPGAHLRHRRTLGADLRAERPPQTLPAGRRRGEAHGEAAPRLSVAVHEADSPRAAVLARHGFARQDDRHAVVLRRPLAGPQPAPPELPAGFTLRPVARQSDPAAVAGHAAGAGAASMRLRPV